MTSERRAALEAKRARVLERQEDVRSRKRARSQALVKRQSQDVEVVDRRPRAQEVEVVKSKRGQTILVIRDADHGLSSMATGIAIGLAGVAVVGVGVVVYYLLTKRDGAMQLGDVPMLREIIREVPASSMRAELVFPRRELQDSHMQTMQLPVMGVSPAIALYKCGRDMPGGVTVRVVGIPGSYGVFAFDPAVLDGFGTIALNNVPAGYIAIIPASATEIVRLKPGQALYGKANVAGVYISIMAAPLVSALV